MKINWSVRFRNPVFWGNIAISIVAPMLVYAGVNWESITTWGALGDLLVQSVNNPVVLVAVAVSVWNAINDPTTAGYSDSNQALTYLVPKKSK
jgi:phi LC3 family holin